MEHLKIFILTATLVLAMAFPQQPPQRTPVPILSQDQLLGVNGTYKYSFETGNGISAQESGYLKNPGHPVLEAQVAQGRYSYTAPDGTRVSVQYIADEGGFRPVVKITPP